MCRMYCIPIVMLVIISITACRPSGTIMNPSVHVIDDPSRDAVKVLTEVSKLAGKQVVILQPVNRDLDFSIYVTVKRGKLRMGTSNGDSLTWFPNGKVTRLCGGKAIDFKHWNLPGADLTLRLVDPVLWMTSLDRLDGKPIDFAGLENAIILQKDMQGRIVLEIESSGEFQGEWTIRSFHPL